MSKKIRIGMIGGGSGSMIGDIHRYAFHLDNLYELVCATFSRDLAKSRSLSKLLNVDLKRTHADFQKMIAEELRLAMDVRAEVIAIVAPNHLHFEMAKTSLEAGFHVILEKPITHTVEEANILQQLVKRTKKLMCVLYTFSGYPMIKELKYLIHSGQLGQVKKILVEFSQGWLAQSEQKNWRTEPEKSGLSGTIADIGTHAFHLAEYVTGLKTISLCAQLNTLGSKHELDDDGAVFLKYDNGASGVLQASQVATGEEANIKIKIYAEKAGAMWAHDHANTLYIKWFNKPAEILRAGKNSLYLSAHVRELCRTPQGHPEGFIEAFANHYRNFAKCLRAQKENVSIKSAWNDYPKIEDGVRGMHFIEAAVASNCYQKWQEI